MRRALATLLVAAFAGCAVVVPPPPPPEPPPAPREFRAAWVASVANIDWPSRPGLSTAQQRAEIVRIVERAQALGLNALIVQVRPAADALYASALEPWSEYLTGEQGRAPEPAYDPLAAWIEEAHRRGIELHAWFNPYRARHSTARSPLAPGHVANTMPQRVKAYGDSLWLDPGDAGAARHTLDVIADVVRRYDVDAVHVDDYFYPYPVNAGSPPAEVDFPDDASWGDYVLSGGTLTRAAWRRRNVDQLVERIHATVHREKPWVRFGISPFGLGRPDRRPAGIVGFSQYDKLYADVELWLARGWLDYLAPQLYWPIGSPGQPFGVLLDYWRAANASGKHVWPGLFTSRINDTPQSWLPGELVDQVALTRARRSEGHIHFSMAALLEDRKGIATALKASYAVPALVPATPWLAMAAPAAPVAPMATVRGVPGEPGAIAIDFAAAPGEARWLLAIWARHGDAWSFSVAPAAAGTARVPARAGGKPLDALVVSTVSRVGLESPRARIPVPPSDPR
jgi:uncharacterized lipoprotein YddW (UPF0748 family)